MNTLPFFAAALYVDPNGTYSQIPGLDLWGKERDARNYRGPLPVIAHPPCERWCVLAPMVEARWGHKVTDDGGTFAHALECVRQFGGVLEHPAYSFAWAFHSLPRPDPKGGWQRTVCGGWVCSVDQAHYGHPARKRTWLYAAHVAPRPRLFWGPAPKAPKVVSYCKNKRDRHDTRPTVTKSERNRTPIAFAWELAWIARHCTANA